MHIRTNVTQYAIFCSLLAACGTESNAEPLPETEYVQAQIKNGLNVGTKRGVLEIYTHSGAGRCTGALINSRWLITAAHCVDPTIDNFPSGDAVLTVYNFSNDAGERISNINETMEAHIIETWDCHDDDDCYDFQDDIAIVKRKSGVWTGTSSGDYFRLNGGTSSGSIFDIGTIYAYGRGYVSDDGTGDGYLRRFPVTPAWAGTHGYYDLEGTRGVCRGDSGGPHIGVTSSVEVIAGVIAGGEVEPDDLCARDGGRQDVARTNSRIDWIMSKVSGCTKYAHHTKCF